MDCDCRELQLYLQIAFDLSRPVHTRFQNERIRDRYSRASQATSLAIKVSSVAFITCLLTTQVILLGWGGWLTDALPSASPGFILLGWDFGLA